MVTDLLAASFTANGTLDTGGKAHIFGIIANGTGTLVLSGTQNGSGKTWLTLPLNASSETFTIWMAQNGLQLFADQGSTVTVNIGALNNVTLLYG